MCKNPQRLYVGLRENGDDIVQSLWRHEGQKMPKVAKFLVW